MLSRIVHDAGMTTNLKECAFFTSKLHYLGHIIRPGQRNVGNYTPDTTQKLKTPTTVTELGTVSELCNVLRRFKSKSRESHQFYQDVLKNIAKKT